MRSIFVSLDGVDGAGKSTQCQLLAEWLRTRGLDVVACADPGGTDLGQRLRELLLTYRGAMSTPCEALLFMASRAQLVQEVIRPALAARRAVVCDRYLLANVVYQGHAGGLAPEQLWQVGELSTGGLQPDLTVVLDLPVEATASRRKQHADRMEQRAADYHARVRAGFLAEAGRQPQRIAVVDASPGVDQVQQAVRDLVRRRLLEPAADPG